MVFIVADGRDVAPLIRQPPPPRFVFYASCDPRRHETDREDRAPLLSL